MPGRRPLLTLVALCAVPLPACLHISAEVGSKPVPITTPEQGAEELAKAKAELKQPLPAPPKGEFKTLPNVPGSSVPTKPGAPVTTAPNPTVQKPNDPQPAPPPTQTIGAKVPGAVPEPFPLLPPFTAPPEAPLLAAVRAYTEGRPEQAIEIIRKMDKHNQDFVLAVLPILARGASADLANDPATAAALAEQLRGTLARIEPLAALKIEKVAFCSHVKGFGQFVSRAETYTHKPNEQVQLYLELRNLGNQLTADGFLTHVHAAVEIRDANDKLVPQIEPGQGDLRRRVPVVKFENKFVTRSPLQDFHVLYIFSAPPAPGVYTVTVELTDSAGRRTVKSAPAEFRVAGP